MLCSILFSYATAPTEIYTLSLHDALPICCRRLPSGATSRFRTITSTCSSTPPWTARSCSPLSCGQPRRSGSVRSEEHTSELQSLRHLVCRLLLEKKKIDKIDAGQRYCSRR